MKKLISMFLVCVLVSGYMFIPAEGSEITAGQGELYDISEMTAEELVEFAWSYFPECRSSSWEMNTAADATNESVLLTTQTTKQVSDTLSITYYEYTNTLSLFQFTKTVKVTSSSSGSGYQNRTVNVTVVSPASDYTMQINGIKYTIVSGGYDQIVSYGTSASGGYYTKATLWDTIPRETASSVALCEYSASFPPNENAQVLGMYDNFIVTMTFKVGNDTADAYLEW